MTWLEKYDWRWAVLYLCSLEVINTRDIVDSIEDPQTFCDWAEGICDAEFWLDMGLDPV